MEITSTDQTICALPRNDKNEEETIMITVSKSSDDDFVGSICSSKSDSDSSLSFVGESEIVTSTNLPLDVNEIQSSSVNHNDNPIFTPRPDSPGILALAKNTDDFFQQFVSQMVTPSPTLVEDSKSSNYNMAVSDKQGKLN